MSADRRLGLWVLSAKETNSFMSNRIAIWVQCTVYRHIKCIIYGHVIHPSILIRCTYTTTKERMANETIIGIIIDANRNQHHSLYSLPLRQLFLPLLLLLLMFFLLLSCVQFSAIWDRGTPWTNRRKLTEQISYKYHDVSCWMKSILYVPILLLIYFIFIYIIAA